MVELVSWNVNRREVWDELTLAEDVDIALYRRPHDRQRGPSATAYPMHSVIGPKRIGDPNSAPASRCCPIVLHWFPARSATRMMTTSPPWV